MLFHIRNCSSKLSSRNENKLMTAEIYDKKFEKCFDFLEIKNLKNVYEVELVDVTLGE